MSKDSKNSGWYCADCNSTNIHHDAIAKWNPEKRDYEVYAILDDCWCGDCQENSKDTLPQGTPVWGVQGND